MVKTLCLLLVTILLTFQLTAQKTKPAPKTKPAEPATFTITGDWMVLAPLELTNLVQHKNAVYGLNNNYSGKKEMYRITNNKIDLFLSDSILHWDNASYKAVFDSKSNIYFLFLQFGNGGKEVIRKWDGKKLIPYGDEPGNPLSLYQIFVDTLDNIIGEVRPGPGYYNMGDYIIFKDGKWVDTRLASKEGFSNRNSIQSASDGLRNLYVHTSEKIVRWNGREWLDIPTGNIPKDIRYLLFNSDNTLHAVMRPSYRNAGGSIYKYENGEWTELKLGFDFFEKIGSTFINYKIVGKDKFYAFTDSSNRSLVYSWTNNQWTNTLLANPDLTTGTYSVWATNNDLFMVDFRKPFVAKWDADKKVVKKVLPVIKTAEIAPYYLTSQGKSIRTILPGSICIITGRKENDAQYRVGDTLKFVGPGYSFDNTWFESGMARTTAGALINISKFTAKVIFQPEFKSLADCSPLAVKPTDNFGFGKGVKVKVLAIGDLDKDQYARRSSYIGKEFTVYSSTHPVGGCWYWGMFEAEGKLHILMCAQLQKLDK